MKNKDNELGINEVRTFIFEKINGMSDEELRQLLKELEERENKERRQYDRKDFLRIIDYNVEHRYYRDFIQNISESGLLIEPPQTFSVGQKILMTFMSPDYQKPFKINGEIVRVSDDGTAVRFKLESQDQKENIKSLMDMIKNS
ncbi:MAG: PilZ domain-containing protein [Desulfobacterales bacterium]|jgi:hypothetical protein